MAKADLICISCGHPSLQWQGKCSACGEWGSLVEKTEQADVPQLVALGDVDAGDTRRLPTGIGEFDRVLGGGLVPGSTVLLAGEPGVGKSTLTIQAASGLSANGARVALLLAEESLEQVAGRASRLGQAGTVMAARTRDLPSIVAQMPSVDVAVVDSIQAISDPAAPGDAGSASQVRHCAAAIANAARECGTTVLMIGHVTKEGGVAGPKTLEHLVDAVLAFEGDRGHDLRMIRGVKNRFGPTSELGVFEMTSSGLSEMTDASRHFLSCGSYGPGSVVGCAVEGRRPVALVAQALATQTDTKMPRRLATGFDSVRVSVLCAVLEKHGGISLKDWDVYCRVAGGLKINDPALDLALALAISGSRLERSLPRDAVAIGELGLGGELRPIPALPSRLKEAERLGFSSVIAPAGAEESTKLKVIPVSNIKAAIELLN